MARDTRGGSALKAQNLHRSVYRNDFAAASRAIENGADVNAEDNESGWTPLHKALYWGHLQIAALLLHKGASMDILDSKGRPPLGLLAEELRGHLHYSRPSCVYSWGSGASYTLGTGCNETDALPGRLESLQLQTVTALAAAKLHSCAVTRDGRLYTWGWARGGRLGHPDFAVERKGTLAAQIHPRLVDALAKVVVTGVAAAKHHTLACTDNGDVYAWGSNAHGRLGLVSSDAFVWTPRRLGGFKHEIVAVAASNKHSAAVARVGVLYTWGCNSLGQLGYNTSGTVSPTARVVDAMKDRAAVTVSVSKVHSVVLTRDGEVFMWGNRSLAPMKVSVHGCRDIARSAKALRALRQRASGASGGAPGRPVSASSTAGCPRAAIHFHKDQAAVMNPRIVAVAAGFVHTSLLTETGAVLCFRTADPDMQIQEVEGELGGRVVVKIAAAKTRTVVATDCGEVYDWEARLALPMQTDGASQATQATAAAPWIAPKRVDGIRRAVALAVGEKHTLALQGLWVPTLPATQDRAALAAQLRAASAATAAAASRRMSLESSCSDGSGRSGDEELLARCAHARGSASLTPRFSASLNSGPAAGRPSDLLGSSPVASSIGSIYGSSPSGTFVPRPLQPAPTPPTAAGVHRTPSSLELPSSQRDRVAAASAGSSTRSGRFCGAHSASPDTSGARLRLQAHAHAADAEAAEDGDFGDGVFRFEEDEPRKAAAAAEGGRALRLFDLAQLAAAEVIDIRRLLSIMHWADCTQAKFLLDICIQVAVNNMDALLQEPAARPWWNFLLVECPHLLADMERAYKQRFDISSAPAKHQLGEHAARLAASCVPRPADVELLKSFEAPHAPLLAPPQGGHLAVLQEEGHEDAAASPERVLPTFGAAQLLQGRRPTAGRMRLPHVAGDPPPLRADDEAGADASQLGALELSMDGCGGRLEAPTAARGPGPGEEAKDKRAKLVSYIRKQLQQVRKLEAAEAGGQKLDRKKAGKLAGKAVLEEALRMAGGTATVTDIQTRLDSLKLGPISAPHGAPETGHAPGGHGPEAAPHAGSPMQQLSPAQPSVGFTLEPAASRATAAPDGTAPSSLAAALTPSAPTGAASGAGTCPVSPRASAEPSQTPSNAPETVHKGFETARREGAGAGGRSDRPKVRKGGLSMFLAGELDECVTPPTLAPADAAPDAAAGGSARPPPCAWGRRPSQAGKPAVSMNAILAEAHRGLPVSDVPRSANADSRPGPVAAAAAGPATGAAAAAAKATRGTKTKLSMAQFNSRPMRGWNPLDAAGRQESGGGGGSAADGGVEGGAAPAWSTAAALGATGKPPSLTEIMKHESIQRRNADSGGPQHAAPLMAVQTWRRASSSSVLSAAGAAGEGPAASDEGAAGPGVAAATRRRSQTGVSSTGRAERRAGGAGPDAARAAGRGAGAAMWEGARRAAGERGDVSMSGARGSAGNNVPPAPRQVPDAGLVVPHDRRRPGRGCLGVPQTTAVEPRKAVK